MPPRIEYLTLEDMEQHREVLLRLLNTSAKGNVITEDDLSAEEIMQEALTGRAVVFLGYEGDDPTCVLVIQFYVEVGKKGATVLAFSGKGAMVFKRHYWKLILDWLRANKIIFLDAFVDEKHTAAYRRKFGFDKSCGYVRMKL